MRQVIRNVYQYHELGESAKERARQEYASREGYLFSSDAFKSLDKLTQHFGGQIKNYAIDYFGASYSSAEFSMPDDMDRDEIERRLGELGSYNPNTLAGNGDCKLTGYCADEDAIDGFRRGFYRMGESSLEKLMEYAFDSWLKACQADCESFYSDEDDSFADHCDANKYEFNEDGSFFSP